MTTLIYILGGLGASQVVDIVAGVSAIGSHSGVMVAPSATWDGWLTRIAQSARVCPSDALVLIGHSFGGQTVWRACDELAADGRRVDLLIGLDEVDPGWGDIKRPENMPRAYKRFRAARSFPVRPAPMEWSVWEQVPGTDHNSLCHNQYLIDRIVELVRAVATGSPVGV